MQQIAPSRILKDKGKEIINEKIKYFEGKFRRLIMVK